MNEKAEKRRFTRVPFEGTARLQLGEQILTVELLDLSVRGAQLRLPSGASVTEGAECRLVLILEDSAIHLKLESQVRHVGEDQTGLVFNLIDVTDMQHLRRLVELNLGEEGELGKLVRD